MTTGSVRQWFINWAQGSNKTSTADKLSAYFAARRVIAEDISKIPGRVVRVDGATRTPLPQHRIRKILWRLPNPTMLAVSFKETLINWAIDYGGGIAEIEFDGRDEAKYLWPIHPSRVKILRDTDSNVTYQITNDDGSVVILEQSEVFHLPGYSLDGIEGYSMLGVMNEVLKFGLEIQRFGNAFLENNGVPPMIISPKDGSLKSDTLEEIRKSWQERYSGSANAGKTAWLPRALQIDSFDINQSTAQIIENKKFTVEDIARFMRMNPDKIMQWENANYNTLEASSTSHVDNMMSWFIRLEQESERKLLTAEEFDAGDIEVKFTIAALLRSDLKARGEFYRTLWGLGVITQNEIRTLEDLNPFEGGDLHYVQGAFIPTDIYNEWVSGERDGLTGGGNQNNIAAESDNGNGHLVLGDVEKIVAAAIMESKKT